MVIRFVYFWITRHGTRNNCYGEILGIATMKMTVFQDIMSVAAAIGRYTKTKASLTATKSKRIAFALPARVRLVLPKCKHYQAPDQNDDDAITWPVFFFAEDADAVQSISKWNLSLQWFIFFGSRDRGFTPKESFKSFSVFYNFQMDKKCSESWQLITQFLTEVVQRTSFHTVSVIPTFELPGKITKFVISIKDLRN